MKQNPKKSKKHNPDSDLLAKQLYAALPQEYKDTLQNIANDLNASVKIFSENYSKIQKFTEEINKFIQSVDFKNALQRIRDTIQPLIICAKKMPEANQILISLGWWYLDDLDMTTSSEIVELHEQGRDREIERDIVNAFKKDLLIAKIEEWEKNKTLTRGRIKIVKDAVKAHINKNYTLSVPVLFAQIEGEIRERLGLVEKNSRYNKLRSKFKAELVKDADGYDLLVSEGVINVIEDLLKGHKLSKKRISRKISRHTVMHGLVTNYNKRSLSLKLILLFDFIQREI